MYKTKFQKLIKCFYKTHFCLICNKNEHCICWDKLEPRYVCIQTKHFLEYNIKEHSALGSLWIYVFIRTTKWHVILEFFRCLFPNCLHLLDIDCDWVFFSFSFSLPYHNKYNKIKAIYKCGKNRLTYFINICKFYSYMFPMKIKRKNTILIFK